MEMLIMPMGKGTYGSKVGRPKKKSFIKQVDAPKGVKKSNGTAKKLMAKNPKLPKAVAKAISKNMKKR
tara:strand:- start:42 stop:245 length:204 start_codon:yes stop_codon:yes gene_type:complete